MEKPITIIRAEFVDNMANLINNSMLPPFVIESILKDMYLETKAVAQKQYEYDKLQYESFITKSHEAEMETARKDDKRNKEDSK